MTIYWVVNGMSIYVSTDQYKIEDPPSNNVGFKSSTLHVLASENNNNISVQCVIVVSVGTENDVSEVVFFHVLGMSHKYSLFS